MDLATIKMLWEQRAAMTGSGLEATTLLPTLKMLEIEALGRALGNLQTGVVLEAGCGNGHTCIGLARKFPQLAFHGFDYVPAMIEAARQLAEGAGVADRCFFYVGDVLRMPAYEQGYDAVFTDRLLINLNATRVQDLAIRALAAQLKSGGALLLLEAFTECHARINMARQALGLEELPQPPLNFLMSEQHLREVGASLALSLEGVDSFAGLHDLLLYALLPASNGGKFDMNSPLLGAVAALAVKIPGVNVAAFSQNLLFAYRKN